MSTSLATVKEECLYSLMPVRGLFTVPPQITAAQHEVARSRPERQLVQLSEVF